MGQIFFNSWKVHQLPNLSKIKSNVISVFPLNIQMLFHLLPISTHAAAKYNSILMLGSDQLVAQGRSQPHSPIWARLPLSSFFSQISNNFHYFYSNFSHFLPHFGPPGGRLVHPERLYFSRYTTSVALLLHCIITPCRCYSSQWPHHLLFTKWHPFQFEKLN